LGLDGCRGGWIVVTLSATGSPSITAIPSIGALATFEFHRAAIDIPIGLPASGVRICDRLAQQMLAPHASRVFTGVRREFMDVSEFDAREYVAANERLRGAGQSGISLQLWNILSKIKEVDGAIRSDAALRARLREVHPELVFRRLNGDRPVAGKKSSVGVSERIKLLSDAGLTDADAWISRDERRRLTDLLYRPRMSVQPDDVLDACAAAIAARDSDRRVPEDVVLDDCDLPMQIWF
jgi:predicted RNase H-like nuclease